MKVLFFIKWKVFRFSIFLFSYLCYTVQGDRGYSIYCDEGNLYLVRNFFQFPLLEQMQLFQQILYNNSDNFIKNDFFSDELWLHVNTTAKTIC